MGMISMRNARETLFAVFLGSFCLRVALSFRPIFVNHVNSKLSVQSHGSSALQFVGLLRREFESFATGSNSEETCVSIPFDGSEDRFDRWRFLQEFLDGDHPSSDVVNIILYRVLEGALKYPRPSGGGDTQSGAETIEMTNEVRERIETILSEYSTNGRVEAVPTKKSEGIEYDFEDENRRALEILEQIEGVLPDPVENEDDHKSLWDTIIELHGREAVKINETQNPISVDWKVANTVTRVLLHFDFLTLGIINAPLK